MLYSVGLKYQLKFSADLSSAIGAFAKDVKNWVKECISFLSRLKFRIEHRYVYLDRDFLGPMLSSKYLIWEIITKRRKKRIIYNSLCGRALYELMCLFIQNLKNLNLIIFIKTSSTAICGKDHFFQDFVRILPIFNFKFTPICVI
jgi:hypothetical protein